MWPDHIGVGGSEQLEDLVAFIEEWVAFIRDSINMQRSDISPVIIHTTYRLIFISWTVG